ncbi:hypothetical protein HOLleu_16728 [Holothuria leucospilota]|uniref:Uncharacterized protein n=1 Tax=Holothuria leucospilota TaxID=206669 RepID=A0A9Q1C6T2_HOLLE|nr:hypothetical protein HOLleu_16728 [Holothuria leucospilota]
MSISYLVDFPHQPLTFEVDGVTHFETRTVSDNIVTLTDTQDQFIVTLDYGRDIALINNLRTWACYFSDLENFPINEDDHVPVLVVEEKNGVHQNGLEIFLTPVGRIPYNYVHLTNDAKVAEQCVSKPSFWLEKKDEGRKLRGLKCAGDCWLTICIDIPLPW